VLRCLATLALSAITAAAQVAPTASLTGSVTDPSGAAVPNARVTLTNLETGFERAVAAQTDGSYAVTQVPVGLYRVAASSGGFATYSQSGIRLNVNTPATLDIRLALGAVGETISVTADTVMVNTQSGALSQVVRQQYLSQESTRAWPRKIRPSPGWKKPVRSAIRISQIRVSKWTRFLTACTRIRDLLICCGASGSHLDRSVNQTRRLRRGLMTDPGMGSPAACGCGI
jgi:hypothetical protein